MTVDHDDYPAKLQQPPVPRASQDNDDEPDETTSAIMDTDPDVVQGDVVNPDADDEDTAADVTDKTDEDVPVDSDTAYPADLSTDEADSDVADAENDRGVIRDEDSPVTLVRTGGAHRYLSPAVPVSAVPSPVAPVPTFSPTADTPATETSASATGDQQASWQRIKAGFVDDPRTSVEEAATMVEEAAETLVATIQERERLLRSAWEGNGTDTEKLRTAFRDYRELYDKINQM
jgi:hypothetical protein